MRVSSLLCAVLAVAAPAKDEPYVDLGYAQYVGSRLPSGVDQFLGIRYAKPPVGNLRFKAPQDPIQTCGVQSATQFKPVCVGIGQTPGKDLGEDCLFANIYKPSNADANSKLPVWVYIQDGGYATLGDPNINGSTIVKESNNNIISVSFNYRVGVLGFLQSFESQRNGDLNAGLLDQRKLLQWVQKHIEKFGGDPKHVVIHGDSAGAGAVSHHLTAYGGRKETELFIGAISESTFWPTLRSVGDMEFQYQDLLKQAKCTSTDCLRKMDVKDLLTTALPQPFPGGPPKAMPYWYWLPVIDGGLIPDQSYNLYEQGRFNRVPVLIGNAENEGTFFAANATSLDEAHTFLQSNYPLLTSQDLKSIDNLYPKLPPMPAHADWFPVAAATYGDSTFTCPGNTIASAVAKFVDASKIWNYRCNIQDPGMIAAGLGVPHIMELTAVFGYGNGGQEQKSFATTNAPIIPIVMNYWISFVRTLNPNTHKVEQAPEWKTWGEGDGERLRLETNKTAMESVPKEQATKCDLWKALSVRTRV